MTDVTPRRAEPFSRLSVNVSIPLRDRLERAAARVDESISDYVRAAIEQRVERDERV